MAPYEKQYKQELNPNLEAERHANGLRKTWEAVKDFRMHLPRNEVSHGGNGHENNTHRNSDEHARHQFADIARRYSSTLEGRQNADEKMYADILGIVPTTVTSLRTLDERGEFETQDYSATMHMIEFNGVLRKIIDSHRTIAPVTLTRLIKSATLRYGYGADAVNEVTEQTQEALVGIKHERAFEAALLYLPEGYEIRESTAVEDKHGADFIVRCPNGVVISIDVKASMQSAIHAAKRQEAYEAVGGRVKRNKLILYSGFEDEDFDPANPWQPKQEAIERVWPHIEALLRDASGMNRGHNRNRNRNRNRRRVRV